MTRPKRVRGPQSRGAGRSELIGLSSPRKRGPTATGPSSDQMREIAPFQVVFFNELNFPIPIPFLQLLFPADGVLGPFICLHVYQPVDAVFADECRAETEPVLLESGPQIIGHSDVQGPISTACKYVHVVRHGSVAGGCGSPLSRGRHSKQLALGQHYSAALRIASHSRNAWASRGETSG